MEPQWEGPVGCGTGCCIQNGALRSLWLGIISIASEEREEVGSSASPRNDKSEKQRQQQQPKQIPFGNDRKKSNDKGRGQALRVQWQSRQMLQTLSRFAVSRRDTDTLNTNRDEPQR